MATVTEMELATTVEQLQAQLAEISKRMQLLERQAGTNGAHALCWFDQYGATVIWPPTDVSSTSSDSGSVGCWDAGGPAGFVVNSQTSATSPTFRSRLILLNTWTTSEKKFPWRSSMTASLIQPVPTSGSVAASIISWLAAS